MVDRFCNKVENSTEKIVDSKLFIFHNQLCLHMVNHQSAIGLQLNQLGLNKGLASCHSDVELESRLHLFVCETQCHSKAHNVGIITTVKQTRDD